MSRFIYLIIFIICLFSNSLNAQKKVFNVSYDPDYAPFSYMENQKPEGLLIDFWKLWAEKNNYYINFINGKYWDDSIDLVYSGDADFFLGTYPYENWMKGSLTFYSTQSSLFILKENSKSFSKKASYIIGIIGTDYEEHLKENFPNSKIIVYKDYESSFKDFISRKIDLIYDDKIAIEFFALKNNYFHQIRSIELLTDTPQIKAIAKDENLIKTFNQGFKKLTTNELYEIENKWIINKDNQFYRRGISFTNEEKEFIKNTKLNVSISETWKPFTFISSSNKPNGISSEIWELVNKKIGLNYTPNFSSNFTEQLNSIKTKTNDIIYSTGKTKQREEYSLFTEPYISFPLSIVTLKDEHFIENISYLFDKKIAVGENFTSHKMLKEKFPQLDFLLVKDIEAGLRTVIDKKAFAYIDIKPNLTYNINKLGLNELKLSGNTGLYFDLRMMIREDYPLLQSILNKAIQNISQKEINNIINRWDNIQFEDSFDYKKLWIILAFISIIFLILIYINQLNIKRNKTLKNIVHERTKELQILNKELEQRVELKTKELTRTNYLLDEAQKIARLGSFTYNLLKNELTWSSELFKIFGFYKNEVTPSLIELFNLIHEEDKKKVKIEFFKLKKIAKRHSFEFRIVLKDESIKYLQVTSKATKFDNENNVIYIIGTILDLTQIKELEIQKTQQASILAQQSKMAAMGEMLENIAHQWRQPLSVISTASTGLQIQLDLGNEVSKEFIINTQKSINEHAQYLSKTIDDFRNFFNPNKEKEKFNIEDTINKSLSLLNSRINKNSITLIKNTKPIEIETFESELIQTFLNIFNNAIDALETKELDYKYLFITCVKKNNDIYIKIKDNAGGIPRNIINRIFEPYFTTKHKAKGTGIGLYMSNEIIEKHLNGDIKVSNSIFIHENIKCKGALFKITIPLS